MSKKSAEVRITDHRQDRLPKPYDYGVWAGQRPAGRIKEKGGEFLAYTNQVAQVAPGQGAFLGRFPTVEAAAEKVVERLR